MSARRPPVVLSQRAKQDFDDVLLYTRQRWGVEQRTIYRTKLSQALRRIGEYPELGASRDDLRPGLRALVVEQHVIFYRVEADRPRVLRILHQAQDTEGRFRE
jgi:toxin ParE1/3/4